MQAYTHAPEERADDFVQRQLVPYLAQLVITVNSVTDVLPPAEDETFISLEGQHFISHTEPKAQSNHSGESLEFFAVFGSSTEEESLNEDTVRDGCAVKGFEECLATITIREHATEDRVRDYGTLDLVQFVYGKHSMSDTVVDMKLGGSICVSIECVLERWQGELDFDATELTKEEPVYQVIERHIMKREYGDLYRTRYSRGEWTEYPLISEMQTPAQFKFWSIEGPEECELEGDLELEQVCEAKFRVARSRPKVCKVGQVARSGKMSVLQKYRVWAVDALGTTACEPCSLESLKEASFRKRVGSSEVEFVQVCDEDEDEAEDGDVARRRISDCSDSS